MHVSICNRPALYTLSLTNNYVRRLFVLRTPAVQRDGLIIALSVHVVVVHICTPPLNEEATASRLLEARSGRRSWPMYRWKFGFKPKTSLFSQQSFIDQNRRSIDQPNFGLAPNSLPQPQFLSHSHKGGTYHGFNIRKNVLGLHEFFSFIILPAKQACLLRNLLRVLTSYYYPYLGTNVFILNRPLEHNARCCVKLCTLLAIVTCRRFLMLGARSDYKYDS